MAFISHQLQRERRDTQQRTAQYGQTFSVGTLWSGRRFFTLAFIFEILFDNPNTTWPKFHHDLNYTD